MRKNLVVSMTTRFFHLCAAMRMIAANLPKNQAKFQVKLCFEVKVRVKNEIIIFPSRRGGFKAAHKLSAEGVCDGAKICIREFTCFHTLLKRLRSCAEFSSEFGFAHFCICFGQLNFCRNIHSSCSIKLIVL